jgi:hypothetical protein
MNEKTNINGDDWLEKFGANEEELESGLSLEDVLSSLDARYHPPIRSASEVAEAGSDDAPVLVSKSGLSFAHTVSTTREDNSPYLTSTRQRIKSRLCQDHHQTPKHERCSQSHRHRKEKSSTQENNKCMFKSGTSPYRVKPTNGLPLQLPPILHKTDKPNKCGVSNVSNCTAHRHKWSTEESELRRLYQPKINAPRIKVRIPLALDRKHYQ